MRRYLAYLLILIIAVLIGLEIVKDPGYALFSYGAWTIEMPLWLLVFAVIVIFAILMFIIRAFDNTRFLLNKIAYWKRRRKLLKMQRKTEQGMLELLEGRFKLAEQHLKAGSKSKEAPIMNFLSAAQAANALGAYERRDAYLSKAQRKEPNAQVAILIIQAQLQLEQKQYTQAQRTLNTLYKMKPKHETVLKLMQTLYVLQENWSSLNDILPKLKKYKVIDAEQEEALQVKIYQNFLTTSDEVKTTWQKMPRGLRKNETLILTYANALAHSNNHFDAENFIHHHLKKHWSDDLCKIYGNLKTDIIEKQIHHLEKFLRKQPDNPVILAALGTLCFDTRLWGKAKTYLTNSLNIKPNLQAYKKLGELLEQLGESKEALQIYRKALDINHHD